MKNAQQIPVVGSLDHTKQTSAFLDSEQELGKDTVESCCYYNGEKYSNGSLICMEGRLYQCAYGNWIDQKKSCSG